MYDLNEPHCHRTMRLPRNISMFNHKVKFGSSTAIKPAFGRIFSALLVASLALVPALGQTHEATNTLAGHTPRQVLEGTAIRVGHYNTEQKLRLVLAIQPPHMAEEEQFLKDLQTKGSPNFHKFLTADEWNARFAPSAEDEQKVVDWAQSQGLTVTNRYNHRLIVDLEGTSGNIEKVFGVTINSYQVGEEVDFSNDRNPALPASLSGVVYSVQGLNNIQREHGSKPDSPVDKGPDYSPGPVVVPGSNFQKDGDPTQLPTHPISNGNSAPSLLNLGGNTGPPLNANNFMDPVNLYSSEAYNYDGLQALSHCCNVHNDSTGSPKETSIAIAGFGNFLDSDIVGFQSTYPYLAYNYTSYNIDGTPGCSKSTITPPCATGETTEDIEWTIATSNSFGSANTTSHVYVYLGGNFNAGTYTDMYGQILSDNKTRVMTTSWSCTENYDCGYDDGAIGVGQSTTSDTSLIGSRHAIFNQMAGMGWTLIAASGDRGASDDCQNGNTTPPSNTYVDPSAHTSVAYPASDSDFVAAGGTQLQLYTNGNWDYEHAWQGGFGNGSCQGNGGGSGGGVSVYFDQPGWQSSLSSLGSKRLVPDVSLNALGIGQNLYINGGLNGDANGTSVVAPELAGFFAQENTYLNYIGNKCGTDGTTACTPVGVPTSFIYEDGIGGAPHNPFYNMLSGCNSNDVTKADSLTFYCAGPGHSFDIGGTGSQYDLVSGWGSANVMQLAWGINWELIPAYGSPSVAFTGPAKSTWYNTNQTVSWTVSDAGSGSFPAPGVAGFTQGWDSIPADPYSEPNGGSGNSFYSGPEFPFGTTGCLAFVNNGCSDNGGAQGCHTVHVMGWDNQGNSTGDQTYGPLCYDNVAPTISISNSPVTPASGWWDTSVQVTLTPADPGGGNASGIYTTYYAINSTSCVPGSVSTCSVYNGPFTISGQQQSYIYYFTEDNAGNYSNETYEWVSIDLTPPVTTAGLSGTVYSGSTYESAVGITLNANDTGGSGVASTYYQVDGGLTNTYTGYAFTISALGSHTVKYWSVDGAGNTESTHTVTFAIDSPTIATVTATPNPSLLGGVVKMTATVTATLSGTPTGTVTFLNGATTLGTGTLSGGMATLSTSALPAGPLTLQVSYPGAGNFLATNSVPFDQTVNENTTTTVKSSLNPVAYGQSVTFTAQVTPSNSGIPTGSVGFYAGVVFLGSGTLNGSDIASVATTSLPAGANSITAVYFGDSTYLTSTSSVLTETVDQAAALISPTPGSALGGTSATFTWTAGGGATKYEFRLGTKGLGSSDLYNSAEATTTALASGLVSNIPTSCATLYARLYSWINGAWQYNDYTYTEFCIPVPAALASPTPGSTLTGSSATFTWSAGVDVTKYEFRLGTTGLGSNNVYNSTDATTTALTSGLVSNIPTNGAKLYARIYSWINGAWQYNDYTYTEFGTPTPAVLTSPTPGSALTGSSATFTWSAGVDVTKYEFRLGTTAPGSSDVYNSAEATTTALTSGRVSNIPTTGATLYARIYSYINGAWQYNDYTYTESLPPAPAVLLTPTTGSTLTGSSATFTWSAGVDVTKYEFRLGTTGPGSRDVYNLAEATTTALTSGLVSNIPTTGATLYARIYSWINGAWQYNDYTYMESATP